MRKNLISYSAVSFVSFCFFTIVFHTAANAQAPIFKNYFPAELNNKVNPTPTIFIFKPAPTSGTIRRPTSTNTSRYLSSPYTKQNPVLPEKSLEPTVEEDSVPSPLPTHTPKPTVYNSPYPVKPTFIPSDTPTLIITNTPTQIPTNTPFPQPTIEVVTDLEGLFQKYSDEYHVDKELLKKIARCESGFNPQADAGLYLGMFQFAEQTWRVTRSEMGLDTNPDLRKNAEESIRTAAFKISRGGQNAWRNCL